MSTPTSHEIGWARWIADAVHPRVVTPEQERCLWALSVLHSGPYNLDLASGKWSNPAIWNPSSVRLRIKHPPDLATTDGDRLTALVISAHRHAVRISLSPDAKDVLEIWAHARNPREMVEATPLSPYLTHPTLAHLLGRIGHIAVKDES